MEPDFPCSAFGLHFTATRVDFVLIAYVHPGSCYLFFSGHYNTREIPNTGGGSGSRLEFTTFFFLALPCLLAGLRGIVDMGGAGLGLCIHGRDGFKQDTRFFIVHSPSVWIRINVAR